MPGWPEIPKVHDMSINLLLSIPNEVCPNAGAIRMGGTKDDPDVCIADLCRVLGNKNIPQAVRDWISALRKKDVIFRDNVLEIPGRGRPTSYEKYYSKEPGVYRIMLGSRAENAETFQDWVTDDVLPCIRKHGCYPASTDLVKPHLLVWSQRIEQNILDFRRAILAKHPDYWGIGPEMVLEMFVVEDCLARHYYPMRMPDLPDGSGGAHFKTYRLEHGKDWIRPTLADVGLVTCNRCRDGSFYVCHPTLYHNSELPYFRAWLIDIYMPEHLAEYLDRKVYRDRAKWLKMGMPEPTALNIARSADAACQRLTSKTARLTNRLADAVRLAALPAQKELFA